MTGCTDIFHFPMIPRLISSRDLQEKIDIRGINSTSRAHQTERFGKPSRHFAIWSCCLRSWREELLRVGVKVELTDTSALIGDSLSSTMAVTHTLG
jgi:hypothetical protein